MPRLLQCLDCMTVEIMPDFLGPRGEEEYDPLLRNLVDRHKGPLNRQQLKQLPPGRRVRDIMEGEPHFGNLHKIASDDWNHPNDPEKQESIRRQILKQMWGDHTGYPDEWYALRDTFREDAVICYRRHNSPGSEAGPHACVDWRADSKRLTDKDWRARGDRMGMPREDVYLCHWCPYQSVVTTRIRTERGDYD